MTKNVAEVDLSVLICSTHTRWRTFGQAIQEQIWAQEAALPEEDRRRVEILMLTDNKAMMLGAKRNAMIDVAQGRYVAFVDDDDRLEGDYLPTLLEAVEVSDADVVTFLVSVSLNGAAPLLCRYSKDFRRDRNFADRYERLPNHLMCVKRELAGKVQFPHVAYGEDAGYAKQLHPLLTSEYAIDRVLYHYDFNTATTETQQHLRNRRRPRRHQEPTIDVVMLSSAYGIDAQQMTNDALETCRAGAEEPLNITVLEQAPDVAYSLADRVVPAPGEFNYNRFVNLGAARGRAPWILVCNNDLIFQPGWDAPLLAASHPLVSPKCPDDSRQRMFEHNTVGDHTGWHLSGWCFLIKRSLWEQIGGFDDCVSFWCSDDVVIEQCKAVGVQPMIVPAAKVRHLQSVTLRQCDDLDDLTWQQLEIFEAKYGPHRLGRDPRYRRWRMHRDRSDRSRGGVQRPSRTIQPPAR